MSAKQPSISVLIPVYNSGKLLTLCLDSLAAQDLADIEFICVNDGSTDGSGNVLDDRSTADSRFRVIHQPNGGYGKAMNAGIAAATGKYIGIVEPDDFVEPHMFSTLLQLAESTGADVVHADFFEQTEAGATPGKKYRHWSHSVALPPCDCPEYLQGSPSIWAAIYRRDMLQQHAIRFSETPGASFQDLGFCMRTWFYARLIAFTPESLYHYKVDNPASSTRRMEDGAWAVYREVELQKDLFAQIPPEDKLKRTLLVRRIFHSMQADYKLRITHNSVKAFLTAYSELLQKNAPLDSLLPQSFKRDEWKDLQHLYAEPMSYHRYRSAGASLMQKLFSVRKEAGCRCLRLLGLRFLIPLKS